MALRRERASFLQDAEPEATICPYRSRFLDLAHQAGFQAEPLLPKFSICRITFEDFLSKSTKSDEIQARQICTKRPLLRRLKQSKDQKHEALLNILNSALRQQIEEFDGVGFAPCLIKVGRRILDPDGQGIPIIADLLKFAVTCHNEPMSTLLATCANGNDLLEALNSAMITSNLAAVRMLLRLGVDPNLLERKAEEVMLNDAEKVRMFLRSPMPISDNTIKSWLSLPSAQQRPEIFSLLLCYLADQQYDRTQLLSRLIHEGNLEGLLAILNGTWHWSPPDLDVLFSSISVEVQLTPETAILMAEALVCATLADSPSRSIGSLVFESLILKSHSKVVIGSQYTDAQIVGEMSRDIVAVLRSQAYLKDTCALGPVIEQENVLLLQILLRYPLTTKTIDLAFPLLRKISKKSRLAMTKLLLPHHPTAETISRALRDAVCDYTVARDEALIDALLAQDIEISLDLFSVVTLIHHNDLDVFRKTISHLEATASASELLASIMSMKIRSHKIGFLEAISSQEIAVRILLPNLPEVISDIFRESSLDEVDDDSGLSLDVLLLKSLLLCKTITEIQIDTAIIIPVMLLRNPETLERILSGRRLSRSSIGRCVRAAILHSFADDHSRAIRIKLLLNHAHEDLDFASGYLRAHLDVCVEADPCGHDWPIPTFACLLDTELVFDEDFEYCMQMASAFLAHPVLKLFLDQKPTPRMVNKALQATVEFHETGSFEHFHAAKISEIALCKSSYASSRRRFERICLKLLEAGADPNYDNGKCIRSAISTGNFALLKKLITGFPLTHATVESIWDIGTVFSSATKKTSMIRWMLKKRSWPLCVIDKPLKAAVKSSDLELCRLFLKYRSRQTTCPKGSPCWPIELSDSRASEFQNTSPAFVNIAKVAAKGRKADIFCSLVNHCTPSEFDILNLVENTIDEPENMLWTIYQNIPHWMFRGRYPEAFVMLAGAGRAKACQLFIILGKRRSIRTLRHFPDSDYPSLTPQLAWKAVWQSFFEQKLDEDTTVNVLRILLRTGICSDHNILRESLEVLMSKRSTELKLIEFLVENGASAWSGEVCYGITAARAGHPELLSVMLRRLSKGRAEAATVCFSHFIDYLKTARPGSIHNPHFRSLSHRVSRIGAQSREDVREWDLGDWDSAEWDLTDWWSSAALNSETCRSTHQALDGALIGWGLKDYSLESTEIRVLRVLLQNGVSTEAARNALWDATLPGKSNTTQNISIANLLIHMPGILTKEKGWTPLRSACSRGDIEMCKEILKHPISRSYRLHPILTGLVHKDQPSHNQTVFAFCSIFYELISPYKYDDVIFSPEEVLQTLRNLGRGDWRVDQVWKHFLFVAASTEGDMWSQNESFRTFIYDQLATPESSGLALSNDRLRSLIRWMNVDFWNSDIDRCRNRTDSSLFCAIQGNRHKMIPDLLAFGASRDLTNYDGESVLFQACHVTKTEGFFYHFANLDAPVNDGSLHELAKSYQPELLSILLDYGHDPNYQSKHHCGRTVLEELCLRHFEDPDSDDYDQELSQYHQGRKSSLPSRRQRIELCIELLIDAGAKVQSRPLVPGVKSFIFLAIDNGERGKYELLYILLRTLVISSTTANDIRNQCLYLDMDGRHLSPSTYLEEQHSLEPTSEAAKVARLRQMVKYGIERKRYKLTGPQPPDAVGLPPEVLRIEEERKSQERKIKAAKKAEAARKLQAALALREEKRVRELVLGKECSVCGEETTDPKAVLGALTPSCAHNWSVLICKADLATYLATRMAPKHGRVSGSIPCWAPNCNYILSHHNIQAHANKADFEAYDTALLKQAIHTGESFAECSTPDCSGGGWVDASSTITYFVCEICQRATCLDHNGPYEAHAGKPCPATAAKRAQSERERRKRAKQDKASEKVLKKTAQLGPCGHWVSKIDGCNHMTCSICGSEFCYLCGANYIDIRLQGNSAHKPSCKNYNKIRF